MFTTGFLPLVRSLLLNILVPLVPWILFFRLVFWTRFHWILLWLLSRFVGVGVVAHWLFNIQFVWFGIGIGEYIVLLIFLLVGVCFRMRKTKTARKEFWDSLAIECNTHALKTSWHDLNTWTKRLTWGMVVSILWFLINAFVFATQFPTYADDSFGNRNRPILNILHDGWIKLFGERDEILARWRLGYPVHIAWYKALISEMQWWYNDVYTDLLQWLSVLFILVFLSIVTRQKTKNVFYTLLPGTLIFSLPLIFIHTVESYHDLLVTLYAILVSYTVYEFLEKKDTHFLSLGILLWCIMAYIKIEWLIIYCTAILFSLLVILFIQKKWLSILKNMQKSDRYSMGLSFVLFFLPFQWVRLFHWLWFNPSSLETGEVIDTKVHWEIFDYFKPIFWWADNYWIWLIIVFLVAIMMHKIWKNKQYSLLYFFLVPLTVFILFTLVFLLTNNYQWVLNQTTVNRVYTMVFVLLFAFIWIFTYEYERK